MGQIKVQNNVNNFICYWHDLLHDGRVEDGDGGVVVVGDPLVQQPPHGGRVQGVQLRLQCHGVRLLHTLQYSTVQSGSCTHTTSASPRIKISFRFNLSTVNQSYVLSSPYHIRKEFDLIIDVHCLMLVESYHVVVIIDNLFIVTLFLELLYLHTSHAH